MRTSGSRTRLPLVALTTLVAVGLLVVAVTMQSERNGGLASTPNAPAPSLDADQAGPSIPPPGNKDGTTVTAPSLEEPPIPSLERVELRPPVLQGSVLSATDASIEGGPATWMRLKPINPSSQTPWWSPERIEGLLAGWDSPVEQGTYTFREHPPWESAPSCVLVTDPGHLADITRVESGPRVAPMVLEPASPVAVRVLDPQGMPVAGAIVVSAGWIPLDAEKILVSRTYSSDTRGMTAIHPLPGESVLYSTGDKRRSEIWHGVHAELDRQVELVLRDLFSARGRVVGAPSAAGLSDCEVLVRYQATKDTWNEVESVWHSPIASTPVRETGAWQIGGIPWMGPGEYVFRLQGPSTGPVEIARTVSRPGDTLSVDFDWAGGHPLAFLAVNSEAQPQENVLVVALWRGEDDRWIRYATKTDASGRATFQNCPDARVWARTSGRGFARQAFGPFDVPIEDLEYFTLTLERAGTLRGKCLFEGEPVPSFEVTYWGEDPTGRFSQRFTSRGDGSFEIEDAPVGTVHLYGATNELPASETVTVETGSEEATDIRLELASAAIGSGLVIDGATGAPIPGAALQVFTRFRNRVLDPAGPAVTTDSTGAFRGLELSRAVNSVQVTADGYVKVYVARDNVSRDGVDLGIIPLDPIQDVTLRLVSDSPLEYERYTAVVGARSPTSFASDGTLVLEDLAPKYHFVQIYTPSGGRIDTDLHVAPGDEGPYEISVGSSRTVIVTLDPAEGLDVPLPLWLAASHRDRCDTTSCCLLAFEEDGTATLDSMVGEAAMLQVMTPEGGVIATRWVPLGNEDVVRVTIPLEGRKHHFLFLGPDQEPAREARVTITAPGDPVRGEIRASTDARGRMTLIGVAAEELLMSVLLEAEKRTAPRPVKLRESSEADPIIVQLDMGSRVRLQLFERGEPGRGIPVELFAADGDYPFLWGTSDENGTVEIPFVSEGTYDLRIAGSGYWHGSHVVRATPDPAVERIEVRRLGSVRFQISRAGIPLQGAALEVFSEEQQIAVAEWVTQGLAFAGESGLITDTKGEVLVKGLPNGSYTWAVSAGELRSSGEIQVPPHGVATVPILLE